MTITGKTIAAAIISAAAILSAALVLRGCAQELAELAIEKSPTVIAMQDSIDVHYEITTRTLKDLEWLDTIHSKETPPKGHGQ